uniref:SAM-dependent MTase RsmB/NOP-type domain-containing protein n=1 Tax=Kalanchoe fedtschenkoi TaxID=63787 RepID=A0A7N0T2R5_KALFE
MDSSERYCYKPTLQWNPQVQDYLVKAYGAQHFSRISKALTYPSCYTCIRVNTLKSTSDDVIDKLRELISERMTPVPDDLVEDVNDPATVELQSGIVSKCQVPGLDYVLFFKGSGPHSIDYDACTSDKPLKEVIVSRKCAEAVLRGAQVYVPGVLACSANVEKGDKVAVSVAIEQLRPDGGWAVGITRGIVVQGSEADPQFIERRGLYIGEGTAALSRAGMFRVNEGVAVDMHNRVFKLPSLHGVLEGEIFLQNLPSIISAHALDPQPGERIIDMCAAPGGKTTAIALLMKDRGEVVATDRSHNKVRNIQKLAAEMGLSCINAYKLDALKACRRCVSDDKPVLYSSDDLPVQTSELLRLTMEASLAILDVKSNGDEKHHENESDGNTNHGVYTSKASLRKSIRKMKNGPGRNQSIGGRVENSKGFPPDSFDRVLLDAPCSALGLRPRLFAGEETLESLRHNAEYQRRMFDQAVQLVRPGGVIVYSTCTINPGENEGLVRYALDTYNFLSLTPQSPKLGGPGIVGKCDHPDGHTEEWLRPGEEDLVQRFDPSSPLDTIGFFIAKFAVGPKVSGLQANISNLETANANLEQ